MNRIITTTLILLACCPVALGQWSEPVNVSRLTSGVVAWYPSLAIDSFGTLHASWSHRMSNDADWIEYACKPAGVDTWTLPVRVSRDSYPYRGSVVVIGPGHKPHVVWQSDVQLGHLYITHKEGDTWTIPRRLQTWNRLGHGIRATADGFGRIHAVWNDVDAHHIWYARYQDISWAVLDSIVNDTNPYALHGQDVAADRQGFPHIVYGFTVYRPSAKYYLGYIRETPAGWTIPETLPKAFPDGGPGCERIALDTADRPQVVWEEGGDVFHSGREGDSWSRPVRLDSSEGFLPSINVDPRNEIHVVFSDRVKFMERTRNSGDWQPCVPVDTVAGWGEIVADDSQVHLFWNKAAPYFRDIWYSHRRLEPPAVQERDAEQMATTGSHLGQNPMDANSVITYTLPQPALVKIEILDTSGRILAVPVLTVLPAGSLMFRPYGHLPSPGIYFCRITLGDSTKVVKVVRVN